MTIAIRLARVDDAEEVKALLIALGYQVGSHHIHAALATMSAASDPTFVATEKSIVGLLALHMSRWLHLEQPIARVTALIVEEAHQRRGIGGRLIAHAAAFAREAGCGSLELTTAVDRVEAQAFYRDLGFEQTSIRFKKALK